MLWKGPFGDCFISSTQPRRALPSGSGRADSAAASIPATGSPAQSRKPMKRSAARCIGLDLMLAGT
jgi:hypothetical protein